MASCRRRSFLATWPAFATASSSCWAVLDSVLHSCLFGTFTSGSNANEILDMASMQSYSDYQSLQAVIAKV